MRPAWHEAVRDSRLDPVWLVLAVLLIRAPAFGPSEIDPDESMYMLVGREVLSGNLPYVTTFQEKPLGMPLATALALGVMGVSVPAMRLFGVLAVTVTGLILREIALTLGLSRLAALGVGLLYAVMSTRLGGLATNTELLFAPLTTAAILIAVRPLDDILFSERCRAVALVGVYIGLSIWFKYLAAIVGCTVFIVLFLSWHHRSHIGLIQCLYLALCYTIACGFPTILSGIFYALSGHWEEFWYCNFGFMSFYIAVKESLLNLFFRSIWGIFQVSVLLVLLPYGWIGARQANPKRYLIGAWLVAEISAIVAPWKFYDHYFLILLPPLCVFSAWSIQYFRTTPRAGMRALAAIAVLLIAELWIAVAPWQASPFHATVLMLPTLMLTGVMAYRLLLQISHGSAWVPVGMIFAGLFLWPAWSLPQRLDAPWDIATILRQNRQPDDRLWVVNAAPVIYLLADLPIPTRFVFPHFLVSPFSLVTNIDTDAEIHRILATRPRYLVVQPTHWAWTAPATATIIRDVIERDYRLAREAPTTIGSILLYKLTATP